MEKQASNLRNYFLLPLFLCVMLFGHIHVEAQETSFNKGTFYELGEITVTGVKSFSPQTVVAYTGLQKGQRIQIPGEEISATINKLWKLELFSDIELFITNIDGDVADLELYIQELPTLSDFTVKGIKKGKLETILKDTEIKKGKKMIKEGSKVKVHYTGKLEDGKVFDTSSDKDPIEVVLGEGTLIKGFESGLLGMNIGEKKTIEVEPKDAYGDYVEGRIQEVEKSKLPEDIKVGMVLQATSEAGSMVILIKEIKDDTAILDANHPLAGRK